MTTIMVQVVTYNSAQTIEACLKSVLQQEQVDYSLVVIDNVSQDDTVARVESMGVQCIQNTDNVGYSVAHNQALALSDSTYVLTLNPDVLLKPDYLWELQQALNANPAAGSAAGCLLRVESLDDEPQVVDSTGLYIRRSRRQGLRDDGVPVGQHTTTPGPIFGPDGAGAFYRREMLNDIALDGDIFDSDFFIHKEDIDLCWRAQLYGWGSLYVPNAVAHHVRSFRPGRREKISDNLRYHALRNRYLLMIKNDKITHLLRDLPFILVYEVLILGYLILRERKSLRSYLGVWQLRRKFLQKRHIIQSRSIVDWHRIEAAFNCR